MAIYINADDCINCGACEPECPNTAIYEGGTVWSLGDTKYEESQSPGNFKGNFWQADYYYIVPDNRVIMLDEHPYHVLLLNQENYNDV